jgi:hypothetical protein
MTEAFNDGAHAWMAYAWVYPPRKGGVALIHLDKPTNGSLTTTLPPPRTMATWLLSSYPPSPRALSNSRHPPTLQHSLRPILRIPRPKSPVYLLKTATPLPRALSTC